MTEHTDINKLRLHNSIKDLFKELEDMVRTARGDELHTISVNGLDILNGRLAMNIWRREAALTALKAVYDQWQDRPFTYLWYPKHAIKPAYPVAFSDPYYMSMWLDRALGASDMLFMCDGNATTFMEGLGFLQEHAPISVGVRRASSREDIGKLTCIPLETLK